MAVSKLSLLAGFVLLTACRISASYGNPNAYQDASHGSNYNRGSNSSHNLILGSVYPGDQQLFRQIVNKSSGFFRVQSEIVKFPTYGSRPIFTITCIRALDQFINGRGGYAMLTKGGVGFKNATLLLKSQRGYGFNFIVEIWGR